VVLGARSGGPAPGDPEAAYPDEPTSPESPPVVQTVRPRQDTSLAISVEEPADVDGFYRADLEARVAGPVKKVTKGLGDRVTEGEILVEIDAPDRFLDLVKKEAVVEQREKELELAIKNLAIADAAVKVAQTTVQKREKEVIEAGFEREYRRLERDRYAQ